MSCLRKNTAMVRVKKLLVSGTSLLFSGIASAYSRIPNCYPIFSFSGNEEASILFSVPCKLFLRNDQRMNLAKDDITRIIKKCAAIVFYPLVDFVTANRDSRLFFSALLNSLINRADSPVFGAPSPWSTRTWLIICKPLRAFPKINGSLSARFWVWQESNPIIFNSLFRKSNSPITQSFSNRFWHSKSLISLPYFF